MSVAIAGKIRILGVSPTIRGVAQAAPRQACSQAASALDVPFCVEAMMTSVVVLARRFVVGCVPDRGVGLRLILQPLPDSEHRSAKPGPAQTGPPRPSRPSGAFWMSRARHPSGRQISPVPALRSVRCGHGTTPTARPLCFGHWSFSRNRRGHGKSSR